MRRLISLIAAVALLAVSGLGVLAQPAEPQEGCDYYDETGHNLCEPFQSYWANNGGLTVFGYPITEAEDELNLDLGEEFLTQYFERERMEHHPANAGTPYEILLGRLGNEVLLEMGRDWTTFPKADPSADHYFAETGHAIAPEFWDYWSSHGLDFGDEGYSFAESLALFGYPISEPAVETNSSGDTVLTQWFERARFEHHPDNPEEFQVLLGLLGNEILEYRDGGEEPPPPVGDVIAEGLNSPRGIHVADDGTVYVAEAGIGGDECITGPTPEGEEGELCFGASGAVTMIVEGDQSVAVSGLDSASVGAGEALGPHDVVAGDDGLYVMMGGLGPATPMRDETIDIAGQLGWVIMVDSEGATTPVVDVTGYEFDANPDGGEIDSNPFSLVMDAEGGWVISDAGMNALVHVDGEGTISTLAVFEDRMVDAPPFLELPEGAQIPMQAVPTGVVEGPDGAFYVGELTGFPFVPGMARVWRVTHDGDASVYAEGFTNIIDLAFDGAGNLFVLEMIAGGLLNASEENPASAAAQIVMVAPDGAQTDVPSAGLIFATGLGMGPDGTAYVSNFGVMPGMGQVVAIPGVGEPGEGPPIGEVIADGLNNPRGIHVSDDGVVYVAEAGIGGDDCITVPGEGEEGDFELCFGDTGSVVMISDGEQSAAASGLTSLDLGGGESVGPQDVVATLDGLYVIMGLGADPAERDALGDIAGDLGWIVYPLEPGTVDRVVDVAAYEGDANPDGKGIDSNPYSFVMDGAGGWVVSDAGMNALVHVDSEGTISTLAVFEDRLVDAPPFLGLPDGEQIPMESVPTGVVQGPDGAFYVGELPGFPFEPGMARVWRVTAEGDAEVYAEGFTNIIDVAFDGAGNLYVLEMIAGGLLNASEEDPASAASRIVQFAPDGTQTTVVDSGLIFATGLAAGPDGALYVSNFGVMPGMGQVVRITLE
ncbi:hypothetical protein BH23CHL2_BH23CHL2_21220 [soil metagenome]